MRPPPNSPLGPPFPSAQPGPFGAPGPTGGGLPPGMPPVGGGQIPVPRGAPSPGGGMSPPTPRRPTRKALGGTAPKSARQKLPRTLTAGSRAGAAKPGNGNGAKPKAKAKTSARPAARKGK